MRKVTVTTYYECTDQGFRDYIAMLRDTMPPENFKEFMKEGRTERTSVDPDGMKAITTHQVLE